MHKIEIVKTLLNKYIYRELSPNMKYLFCLYTYQAVIAIHELYPEHSKEFLLKIIAENISVREGRYTSFIVGYTKCARLILAN